jgi:hypothetical protein
MPHRTGRPGAGGRARGAGEGGWAVCGARTVGGALLCSRVVVSGVSSDDFSCASTLQVVGFSPTNSR